MTEQSLNERWNAIFDELKDQDPELCPDGNLFSDVPLKPIPLSAFTEFDKRRTRKAELHAELRNLAVERWPAS